MADVVLNWLARSAAFRVAGVLLFAFSAGIDALTGWHEMGFLGRGLLDEPAHLATALVVFGAIVRLRGGSVPDPRFCWTMLASSVLIDIDHIPAEFGIWALTTGTPRPYTHALWTVVVLALAAAAARGLSRRGVSLVLGGAAAGVAAHFLRDIATAPMSLWWPFTDAPVQVPYWWYVAAVVALLALPPFPPRKNIVTEPGQSELNPVN